LSALLRRSTTAGGLPRRHLCFGMNMNRLTQRR
jgi:hypothetical protein